MIHPKIPQTHIIVVIMKTLVFLIRGKWKGSSVIEYLLHMGGFWVQHRVEDQGNLEGGGGGSRGSDTGRDLWDISSC